MDSRRTRTPWFHNDRYSAQFEKTEREQRVYCERTRKYDLVISRFTKKYGG